MRLAVGLLAVAVLLACVASNALYSDGNPEVEIDMAEKTSPPPLSTGSPDHHPEVGLGTARKTETGIPIKIVPLDHAPGENATPVKLVSLGGTPAGGTEIVTLSVPSKTENIPPENLPDGGTSETPPENMPPEVPPEKPPEKPPEAPPAHIELIPSPPTKLVRAEPENWPGERRLESEIGDLKIPDNMRLMPAPELPDNVAQVRLLPAGDVPLPENTVRIKTTEN